MEAFGAFSEMEGGLDEGGGCLGFGLSLEPFEDVRRGLLVGVAVVAASLRASCGNAASQLAQHLARIFATSWYLLQPQPMAETSPRDTCNLIQLPSSAPAQGEMFSRLSDSTVSVSVFETILRLIARLDVGARKVRACELRSGEEESGETLKVLDELTSKGVNAWRCGRGSGTSIGKCGVGRVEVSRCGLGRRRRRFEKGRKDVKRLVRLGGAGGEGRGLLLGFVDVRIELAKSAHS